MSGGKVVQMKRPIVIGTGLLALDMVVGPEQQTPGCYAGGTCGNVLCILAFLGWDAYPVARLGRDRAGEFVVRDLRRWGAKLDFIRVSPPAPTPIIVEKISRDATGNAYHTFSWRCPECGKRFPGYQPVRAADVGEVISGAARPRVFFMDRVSRAALDMAVAAARQGAAVVFEPSGVGEPRLFEEATAVAHVLKYSEERMRTLGAWLGREPVPATRLLEVETLGPGGLRYRTPARSSRWAHLDAFPVKTVVDSAGSGDWCTAGIIQKLLRRGVRGLGAASADQIRNALEFGQGLSAWNCGFEGARGGMYVVERAEVPRAVAALMRSATRLHEETRRKMRPVVSGSVCSTCGGGTHTGGMKGQHVS